MEAADDEVIEYFAIGSMMNRTSLTMRDLNPSKSRPAYLKDFQLIFGMKYGMAAARKESGHTIHGVLHRITKDELVKLDKIETWYIREKVPVTEYHDGDMKNVDKEGTLAYVYVFKPDLLAKDPELFAEHPPKQRYLDILKEGAKDYGVDEDYINNVLNATEFVPRKSISELKSFKLLVETDNLPGWSMEEVKAKDSEQEHVVFIAVNQYVVRLDVTEPCAQREILQTSRGSQLSFVIAGKWIYEPLHGVPSSYEDMSEAHRAEVEDWFIEFFLVGDLETKWKVVASLK